MKLQISFPCDIGDEVVALVPQSTKHMGETLVACDCTSMFPTKEKDKCDCTGNFVRKAVMEELESSKKEVLGRIVGMSCTVNAYECKLSYELAIGECNTIFVEGKDIIQYGKFRY